MSRSAQPWISSSIAFGRPSSTKKSAGPPMPNDVREARGSPPPYEALEHLARRFEIAGVGCVWHLVRQVRGLDARGVLLARAVYIEHQHLVRALERSCEVVHEGGEARITVRLEDDDQARVAQLARRFDRRANLRRVVGVVVVNGRALEDAQQLH